MLYVKTIFIYQYTFCHNFMKNHDICIQNGAKICRSLFLYSWSEYSGYSSIYPTVLQDLCPAVDVTSTSPATAQGPVTAMIRMSPKPFRRSNNPSSTLPNPSPPLRSKVFGQSSLSTNLFSSNNEPTTKSGE